MSASPTSTLPNRVLDADELKAIFIRLAVLLGHQTNERRKLLEFEVDLVHHLVEYVPVYSSWLPDIEQEITALTNILKAHAVGLYGAAVGPLPFTGGV